jgi:hypothetical protein
VKREDDAARLAGIRIAECDLHGSRHGDLGIVVQDGKDVDVRGRPNLDADVLRDKARHPLDLFREDRWRRVRSRRVMCIAASGVRHRHEHVLGEVRSVPDRGRADAVPRSSCRKSDELSWFDDADVRLTVRENQHLPRLVSGGAAEFLDTLEPSA